MLKILTIEVMKILLIMFGIFIETNTTNQIELIIKCPKIKILIILIIAFLLRGLLHFIPLLKVAFGFLDLKINSFYC